MTIKGCKVTSVNPDTGSWNEVSFSDMALLNRHGYVLLSTEEIKELSLTEDAELEIEIRVITTSGEAVSNKT